MDLDRRELFIDGRWVAPHAGTEADVGEAATGKVLGRTALATAPDVDDAVDAARRALNGAWSAHSVAERVQLLKRFAAALKARGRETSALVSRENGMPISISKAANGYSPAMMFEYYADLIGRVELEDVRPNRFGGRSVIRREPVGVVAAVIPWNYPQSLAAMKIAPALAAGCTVVLKPSPETALDAFVFADAALEAGLPAGVLNILPGDRETGAYLVAHPGINKVAFTGSTAAGRAIGETCGRLFRPVTLELGGKSAAIVMPDADLDFFASSLIEVALANNGQTCHATSRILAPRSRYDEVVQAVTESVRNLAVGDPLDKETEIGPLVSEAQRERVLGYIAAGRAGGARLTVGGGIPAEQPLGWFVEPTVFADVENSSRIAQEEIFGPVLTITPYGELDEAVALANDSIYGLAATVWTTDERRGMELADRVEVGSVGLNMYGLDLDAPFGGTKASGIGLELGPEGLQPYLSVKSYYLLTAATA